MRKWLPVWVVPLIILFSIGTVWLRLAIVRTTYAINQTERAIEQNRQNREMLHLKVSGQRSPRKLEELARKKFGLSQPRTDQVIHFKNMEVEGSLQGRVP